MVRYTLDMEPPISKPLIAQKVVRSLTCHMTRRRDTKTRLLNCPPARPPACYPATLLPCSPARLPTVAVLNVSTSHPYTYWPVNRPPPYLYNHMVTIITPTRLAGLRCALIKKCQSSIR